MNKVDQQATHEGRIQIGNYSLRCYVLNNKQRIVNKDDFLSMLGEKKNRQIKYSEALQPLLYATTKFN